MQKGQRGVAGTRWDAKANSAVEGNVDKTFTLSPFSPCTAQYTRDSLETWTALFPKDNQLKKNPLSNCQGSSFSINWGSWPHLSWNAPLPLLMFCMPVKCHANSLNQGVQILSLNGLDDIQHLPQYCDHPITLTFITSSVAFIVI